ncbi:DUF2304 domain-containing protein [Georgenia thermotolerans]|uniref:DUF2304 family protein n=1 Tax=Georgenia thermotolerans TaxID=527326 RepID=A0A7J5UR19_9MICO|nr:DUF2304 domain-containing protein [Georgenia thermotolerans]KAE8764564.1 DUF2304 family protein [Georgenia thermotolerans]
MWIQVLLVAAFAGLAVIGLRASGGARHQAIRRLLLVGFVALAMFSVLFPQWLSWLAHHLGVGRGADLVLYTLVVAFLSFIATTYRRLNELERKLTVLARRLALDEARRVASDEARRPGERPATEQR